MLKTGAVVVIDFGPFAGFQARIVSNGLERIVVRVTLRNRSEVLVELDKDMLKRVEARWSEFGID